MEDLLCPNINSSIFFIYIGFNIAAFSFLCQYLTFPKSLLTDISNMTHNPPPRITDRKVVDLDNSPDSKYVRNILCFFYEIDTITFTILIYILYSILVTLMFAYVHFEILSPSLAFYLVIILSIFYSGIIIRLLNFEFSKKTSDMKNIRDKYWENKYRKAYKWGEILFMALLWAGVLYTLLVMKKGLALFLFLIILLVILFCSYLLPIAYRTPVRNMLSQWMNNKPFVTTPKSTNGNAIDKTNTEGDK